MFLGSVFVKIKYRKMAYKTNSFKEAGIKVMRTFSVTIENPVGLHARPASVLVKTAKGFVSNITIFKDTKRANATSILSVLSLGANNGSSLVFEITGQDEEEALSTLKQMVEEYLGPIQIQDGSEKRHPS